MVNIDVYVLVPGIKMQPGSIMKKVVKERDGTLSLHLQNGQVDIAK